MPALLTRMSIASVFASIDLNASATLLFSNQWRARLYGNNLTNQAGVSAAGPVFKNADFFNNYRVEYVTRPRTVGVALEYSF